MPLGSEGVLLGELTCVHVYIPFLADSFFDKHFLACVLASMCPCVPGKPALKVLMVKSMAASQVDQRGQEDKLC